MDVKTFRINICEKIVKCNFSVWNLNLKVFNNISYIRKVAYIFHEISILVDVTKPCDIFQRWDKV